MFLSSTKSEIKHFHVVVVRRRQKKKKVQKTWFTCKVVVFANLRVCLHGVGGPQLGAVTCLGEVTRLSIQSLILIWSLLHGRLGNLPHVTSPIWNPPPPCQQALNLLLFCRSRCRCRRRYLSSLMILRSENVPYFSLLRQIYGNSPGGVELVRKHKWVFQIWEAVAKGFKIKPRIVNRKTMLLKWCYLVETSKKLYRFQFQQFHWNFDTSKYG